MAWCGAVWFACGAILGVKCRRWFCCWPNEKVRRREMDEEINLNCDNCSTSFETAYHPKLYAMVSSVPTGEKSSVNCPFCGEYFVVARPGPENYPSWFIREANINRIGLLKRKLLCPKTITMSYWDLLKSLVPEKWLSFFRRNKDRRQK